MGECSCVCLGEQNWVLSGAWHYGAVVLHARPVKLPLLGPGQLGPRYTEPFTGFNKPCEEETYSYIY